MLTYTSTNDCISALQSLGLDPYVGFFHKERPGRPSLALDLVEEFRALGDRLALTLINRKQIIKDSFDERPGNAFFLKDKDRKEVLKSFQTRKQETIKHAYLKTECRIGELALIQARLMAKTIRGELSWYPPFIWR